MIVIDVEEAQLHLKDYFAKVKSGEQVIVRDGPVVQFELKQIEAAAATTSERRIGAGIGQMVIHPTFFDPLPEDIQAYFEGDGEGQTDPLK